MQAEAEEGVSDRSFLAGGGHAIILLTDWATCLPVTAVSLVREPFVGGADTMIDVATAHLPNAAQGFLAVFSASYFPDA